MPLFIYKRYLGRVDLKFEHRTLTATVNALNPNLFTFDGCRTKMLQRMFLTAPAVISSNITATINLASISLTPEIIHGNTHRSIISIKYICLLTCFLLAFSCFDQSTRHFFHSNYLLSTVGATMRIDVKKAKRAVQGGSEFWSLGLRALYFVLNFLLWFFGPIPMLASSSVTVLILSCHEFKKPDTNQLRLEAMAFLHFLEEYLDVVLVPTGILIMLIYHLFLLYKYINHPLATAIGSENNDKKTWVGKILHGKDVEVAKKVKTAIDVISSNTSATTTLASISLTLCSLIGAWMANSNNFVPKEIIYGNTNPTTISIKYICLLTCFLLAFSCFVQSARHFVHSNYLLTTPGATAESDVKKAKKAVQMGSEFWSLGIRALYFALNFLLWFFGPIPMFASSVVTVVILSCHDFKKSCGDQKWPASAKARILILGKKKKKFIISLLL
ncbi:unnamed protein product [Malus baccata var. baccata]